MDQSGDKKIAVQALQALQLRRQWERGDLTQRQYQDALNSLQTTPTPSVPPVIEPAAPKPAAAAPKPATVAPKSAPVVPKPAPVIPKPAQTSAPAPAKTPDVRPPIRDTRPKLVSAQETLRRRRPEMEQQPAPKAEPVEPPATAKAEAQPHAPVQPPVVTPRRSSAPKVILAQPAPERSITMKCPRCKAEVGIYDHTKELQCRACGADIAVQRKDFTIVLRLAGEFALLDDSVSPLAARTEELKKLRAEAAMLANVKRAAGLLGVLCGGAFAYAGVVDMRASNAFMGVSILICASALLATVVCITRHTNKQRAQLGQRIRDIAGLGDGAGEHP